MKKEDFEKLKLRLKAAVKIRVSYRCNWHRGRVNKKPDKIVESELFVVGSDYIHFIHGVEEKRISYKSITGISFEEEA